MKVTWIPDNEYATFCDFAELQPENRLAGPRVIVYGLIGWVMVFCVWAWVKVARYF